MFVAVCDQNFGNSTSRCSNAGAALAGDQRVTRLPLDLVERVAPRDREVPPRGDARLLVEDAVDELSSSVAACAACVACLAVAMLSSRAEMSSYSPRRARTSASCERTGHARTRVGRHRNSCKLRKIAPRSTSGVYRSEAAPSAAAVRDGQPRRRDEQRPGERGEHDQRIRARRETSAAAARSAKRVDRARCSAEGAASLRAAARRRRRLRAWPTAASSVAALVAAALRRDGPRLHGARLPSSVAAAPGERERAADVLRRRSEYCEDVVRERADRRAVARRADRRRSTRPPRVPVADHPLRARRREIRPDRRAVRAIAKATASESRTATAAERRPSRGHAPSGRGRNPDPGAARQAGPGGPGGRPRGAPARGG